MGDKLVHLASYPYARAEVIKERLMQEGIESSLTNIHAISAVPGGAVRIWVLEKDYTDAAAILIEMEEEFAEDKIEDIEIVEDIERILCPVNFSDASFEAAKYALNIAAELKAELFIVHAYNFPIVQSVDFMDTNAIAFTEDKTFREIQEDANKGMVDFIFQLKQYAFDHKLEDVVVKSFLLNGHPADEILRFAENKDVHAIILNNYTSDKEQKISFIAEQIIEHANVPVLTLPFETRYVSISNVQVLYITDHSEGDFYSIKKLLTLLYLFNVHIHCLSVYSDVKIAELQTKKWKAFFEKRYPTFAFTCHIAQPDTLMTELKRLIKEVPLEMLATLAHKKGFFEELFNPGFDQKYLFDLKIPVLVFHV